MVNNLAITVDMCALWEPPVRCIPCGAHEANGVVTIAAVQIPRVCSIGDVFMSTIFS